MSAISPVASTAQRDLLEAAPLLSDADRAVVNIEPTTHVAVLDAESPGLDSRSFVNIGKQLLTLVDALHLFSYADTTEGYLHQFGDLDDLVARLTEWRESYPDKHPLSRPYLFRMACSITLALTGLALGTVPSFVFHYLYTVPARHCDQLVAPLFGPPYTNSCSDDLKEICPDQCELVYEYGHAADDNGNARCEFFIGVFSASFGLMLLLVGHSLMLEAESRRRVDHSPRTRWADGLPAELAELQNRLRHLRDFLLALENCSHDGSEDPLKDRIALAKCELYHIMEDSGIDDLADKERIEWRLIFALLNLHHPLWREKVSGQAETIRGRQRTLAAASSTYTDLRHQLTDFAIHPELEALSAALSTTDSGERDSSIAWFRDAMAVLEELNHEWTDNTEKLMDFICDQNLELESLISELVRDYVQEALEKQLDRVMGTEAQEFLDWNLTRQTAH